MTSVAGMVESKRSGKMIVASSRCGSSRRMWDAEVGRVVECSWSIVAGS